MWFMLITVGSVFFWVLAVIELILLTWFVEEEWAGAAFFSVLIFIVAIHLFGDASLPGYVKANYQTFFTWALIYLGAGIAWSLAKFYFYTSKLKRKIEEFKPGYKRLVADFNEAKDMGRDPRPPRSWEDYVKDKLSYEDQKSLQFGNYSSRIIFWLAYWPVSMFWTILNDPIRRMATWVYETILIGIYRKIHQATVGRAMQLD